MDPLRRSILRTGGMMGLAAVLSGRFSSIVFGQQGSSPQGARAGFPIPKQALADPLYKITREMFTQNIGTKFTFSLGGVRLTPMTLIEVNNINSSFSKEAGTINPDSYSLVFRGPRSLPLRQGAYTIEHGSLGTFNLFVVPGDLNNISGLRYGAVINRV